MNEHATPQFEYGFLNETAEHIVKRFGTVFDLPIVASPYREMVAHYRSGNVLDIGAGRDKPLGGLLAKGKLEGGRYYSMDTDPTGTFDYERVEDLPETLRFGLITANQVLEHVPYQAAIDLVCRTVRHLEPGGRLVVTVPNIAHPNRFWTNFTHVTPWNYNNLGVPLCYAGLEIAKIARYSKRHPRGPVEKSLAHLIARIYRMDWCDSILMVGEKPRT